MKKIYNYLFLILLLLIASLNFNIILKENDLVTGGTQGVALLIKSITNIKPSIIIFIINIITLIISYFLLSKRVFLSSFSSSIIYPILVRLTNSFKISFFSGNLFLSSIIAGIVCGLTGGFIYKLGFSSGGVSTINLLINKYFHLSISLSNFIINATIIILGIFLFGFVKALFSLIIIVISSLIINFILSKN